MTVYTHIAENKRRTVIFILVYIVLITAVVYFAREFYGFDYGFVAIAAIFSIIMSFIGYYAGDKVALASSGAKQVEGRDANPYIYNMVENLSITAGLPIPKVYIINDPAINAFATGRDPKHSSVAVTTGAIEKLENEELEGVLAHELSHVGNYDIRVMTIVVVMVGIISIITDMLMRGMLFGGGGRDNNKGGGPLALVGIVLIILSPIVAELIKLSISRKREYLADASGVLLTRYPDGLAKALEKISLENRPMARASNATAHLFISSPFSKKKFASLFSTHPPIEDRIKKLRGM